MSKFSIYNQGVEYLRRNGIKVDFFDEDLAKEIRVWNKDFIDFMQNTEREKETSTEQHGKLGGPSREEERSVPEASVEDFSYEAIQDFLKYQHLSYAVPSQELWAYFRKAKYLVRREDRDVPTLAGVVLFAEKPEIFLPEHTITAECFSGTPEDGISLDKIVGDGRENITGPLFDTVEACMNFYKKHVAKVPRIKGFQRTEDYEYPEVVIREAIVNALVHRDYTVGAHISFRMFRDRIIIKSPGHLLSPNTIERVRRFDVTSVRRNQRIAAAAQGMKLMEREGYGIPNMPSQLEKYGLRPPNFDYDGGYFVVTFYGRKKLPPVEELNERQKMAIEYINDSGKITTKEYTKLVGVSLITAKRDLLDLKNKKIIKFVGSPKTGYYCFSDTVNDTVNDKAIK